MGGAGTEREGESEPRGWWMGSGEGRGEAPLGDRPLQPPQHPVTQRFCLHHPRRSMSLMVPASLLWPFRAFPLHPLVPPALGALALHSLLSLSSSPRSPHGLAADSPLAAAQPLTASPPLFSCPHGSQPYSPHSH